MGIYMKRVLSVAPERPYLHRAGNAVSTVTTELPGMRLSPETREELALVLAALMGELERQLSIVFVFRGPVHR